MAILKQMPRLRAGTKNFFSVGQWLARDIKYKDLNGDGKIDQGDNTIYNSGDRRIIGNSTPRYQYSINLDFQYKISI